MASVTDHPLDNPLRRIVFPSWLCVLGGSFRIRRRLILADRPEPRHGLTMTFPSRARRPRFRNSGASFRGDPATGWYSPARTHDHLPHPVQPPESCRRRAALHPGVGRLGPDLRRRRLHGEVPPLARGAAGRPPRPADDLLHDRARDGRPAPRPRARRRGDHALVHLRLYGERRRAPRGAPGLRRHPSGHAEPRRAPAGGRWSRPARGRSCPCTTPASAARWTRSWRSRSGTGSRWSRTTRRASSASTAAGRSAPSGAWPP